jgi:hypothetical protein
MHSNVFFLAKIPQIYTLKKSWLQLQKKKKRFSNLNRLKTQNGDHE